MGAVVLVLGALLRAVLLDVHVAELCYRGVHVLGSLTVIGLVCVVLWFLLLPNLLSRMLAVFRQRLSSAWPYLRQLLHLLSLVLIILLRHYILGVLLRPHKNGAQLLHVEDSVEATV